MDHIWVVGLILPEDDTKAVAQVRSYSVDIVTKDLKASGNLTL